MRRSSTLMQATRPWIRVSLVTAEGGCLTDPFATTDQAQPFLLDLSLRRLAPSGTSIQQAVAQSRNQF
jgi:hypothetical protein